MTTLLVSQLLVGQPAPAPCQPTPAKPFDLKALAATIPREPLPPDRVEMCGGAVAREVPKNTPPPLLETTTVGGITYAVWQICKGKACTLHLGEVELGSEPKVVKRAQVKLPLKPGGPSGIEVQHLLATDLDGDGLRELILKVAIEGPQRAVVGALSDEVIAIFNLPALTPAWQAEVARFAGADHEMRCEYALATQDVDCDGHPDLVLEQTCGQDYCFPDAQGEADPECKKLPEKKRTVYRWLATADRFELDRKARGN